MTESEISEKNVLLFAEDKLATFVGQQYCTIVGTGTAALIIALKSLNLPHGSGFFVSALACHNVIMAIKFVGFAPVFIDIDPLILSLNREAMNHKIDSTVKGIIAIHHFGQAEEIAALRDYANEHSLFLIEDFAQSFGGKVDRKMMGSFGDISITSFGSQKILDCGGGGALFTSDKYLYNRMIRLSYNLPVLNRKYKSTFQKIYTYLHRCASELYFREINIYPLVLNLVHALKPMFFYKADPSMARAVLKNLENIDDNLGNRKKCALMFKEGIVSKSVTHLNYNPDEGTCFRYSILVPPKKRDIIILELGKQGIFCSKLYSPPLHRLYAHKHESLPGVEYVADRILNFKVSPVIKSEEIDIINRIINRTV